MPGTITTDFLAAKRATLALLAACLRAPGELEAGAFDAFRHGLLLRVGMEERVLLPAVELRLGRPLPGRNALSKDHRALVSLCVAVPRREWVENLEDLLARHNAQEEAPDGLYPLADRVLGGSAPAVLLAMHAWIPMPLPPLQDGVALREAESLVLRRLGLHPVPI